MKRFIRVISFVLVLVLAMSTTAFAAEIPEPRASDFFTASSVYFWHTSGNNYQIWFDVTAVGTMTKLGVSEIKVLKSTDKVNWTTVKTYDMDDYSQMTRSNTVAHASYVPFTATTGYYYVAEVTLYAKNSSGTAEMTEETAILDLR